MTRGERNRIARSEKRKERRTEAARLEQSRRAMEPWLENGLQALAYIHKRLREERDEKRYLLNI
jgi:hypothetical protein